LKTCDAASVFVRTTEVLTLGAARVAMVLLFSAGELLLLQESAIVV
jgi:hypothetical protein